MNIAPRQTFCSLIASLPDGRLAIIGGGSDWGSGAVPDVQIYDAEAKTFSVMSQMNFNALVPGRNARPRRQPDRRRRHQQGNRTGQRVHRREHHA